MQSSPLFESYRNMNYIGSGTDTDDYNFDDFDFELFEGNRITKSLKSVGLFLLCIIAIPVLMIIFAIRRLMGKDKEFTD